MILRRRLELAFVWARRSEVVKGDKSLPDGVALEELSEFASMNADLIVEVAHPSISERWGAAFLHHADYLVTSVTAFADAATEGAMRAAAASGAG